MKTLTKEQFLEYLIKNEVYKHSLDWAKAQVSARDIIEKCTNNDHLYWLIEAIGGPMEAEYWEKEAPFRAEYDELIDPMEAEYEKQVALLWSEYDELIDPIFAEYEEKVAPIWAEYLEKVAPLFVEYNEKNAPIWAEYKEKKLMFRAEYDEKCNNLVKEICTFERVQEAIGS